MKKQEIFIENFCEGEQMKKEKKERLSQGKFIKSV